MTPLEFLHFKNDGNRSLLGRGHRAGALWTPEVKEECFCHSWSPGRRGKASSEAAHGSWCLRNAVPALPLC